MNNVQTNEPKQTAKVVKILAVIGCFFGVVILPVLLVTTINSLTSDKLVCKSEYGNITIMYNDKNKWIYSNWKINL